MVYAVQNKKTFYYMDLMQLPDELDLADLEAENEKLERKRLTRPKPMKKRLQEEFEGDEAAATNPVVTAKTRAH